MKHKRVPPDTHDHQFTFTEDECRDIMDELWRIGAVAADSGILFQFYRRLGSRNV